MKKKIAILGSTGSIGTQTLEIIKLFKHNFSVSLLTANSNVKLLLEQIKYFNPKYTYIHNINYYEKLKGLVSKSRTTLLKNDREYLNILKCSEIDLVIISLVGIDALLPTLTAIEAKKDIGLATKEVLVGAGNIIMNKIKEKKVTLLPIDSEHCAIHQCISGEKDKKIKNIILTASGGPFLSMDKKKLKNASIKDALSHPKWNMGRKISIDSATLMNKGLEVIEAHYLFNVPYENIKVVIHPQSIVHSLVEFEDGSIIAQLSLPDMRFPIQYVLTYPKRYPNPWPKLNLEKIKALEFSTPDLNKFPCLKLAYEAGKRGSTYPTVLNASNEAAVKFFLEGKIKFLDIPKLVSLALNKHTPKNNNKLKNIVSADAWARREIYNAVKQ